MAGKNRNSVAQLNRLLPIPIELENHAGDNEISHVTNVLVGDHHIVGDTSGYVVWTIKVTLNDSAFSSIILYKRYSDIEKFRTNLVQAHPRENIPNLPPKDAFSVLRMLKLENWLEERRRGLQWFLTSILLNPRYLEEIKDFLLK